jgi:YHS domain-containing protein
MANCIICKSEFEERAGIVVTEEGKKYCFCQFGCLSEFCWVVEEYDGYEDGKGHLLEMSEDSMDCAYQLYQEAEKLEEELEEHAKQEEQEE